jgi:ddrB-like ParB superfamily domain/Zeta toxin
VNAPLPPGFELERPARPAARTTPAATALGGATERQPAMPARAPQAAAAAGMSAVPALPPGFELEGAQQAAAPREVGFMESAGRTAGAAATAPVRMGGLAVGGLLEGVKKAAALADTIAPMFGLQTDYSQRVAAAQDQVFAFTDRRAEEMRGMYAPKPGEEFGIGGQIAGGVASLPMELAGGLGIARGVERGADVVQRGGTMGEAATAGGVTAGANLIANALPIKLGGAAGRAVERGLGGGRAAAIGAGAATGAALSVGGDAAVVGAENLALPAGEQFADLQQEASPAVSGGLGLGLGALAGAVGAPQLRAPRRAAAAPTPTPGTQASASAAGTDMATQRRERAAAQGIPLTEGQATRSFEQQRFERETAKDPDQGAPLRERAADQNERVLKRFDELVDETGAQEVDPGAAGRKIVDPILKKAEAAKREIRAAYDDARAAGDMDEPIDYAPVREFIAQQGPTAQEKLAPVLKMVDEQLAANDPEGTGAVPINALEDVRKAIRKTIEPGTPNEKFGGDLIRLIDEATEGKGGELYKRARGLYRDYAAEFKNQGAIRDLIYLKKGTTDRKVAFEDVVRRSVQTGSVDDLANVKRTLTSAGDDGLQAWREVQGQAMRWIQEQATKNVARDTRGNPIVSPAGLSKAVQALDKEGKLDILFGKKGAETLRDIDDLAKDLFTSPPGAVNTSNTASVMLKWMADSGASMAATGVPIPFVMGGKALLRARGDRKVRKQVEKALGDTAPVKPLLGRVIEQPTAAPAPPPRIPTGLARELPASTGKAPLLRKLPVGEATDLPPATGRAPGLPRLPVGDVIEGPLPDDTPPGATVSRGEPPKTPPLPAGEARELDDVELAEWSREFGLGAQAQAESLRLAQAVRKDAAAVENAAVQHARQPTAFARAIDRILEAPDETVTAAPAQGREGLPGPRGSEEGRQQGQRVVQEGSDAAAGQEVAPTQRALTEARAALERATEPTGNPITDALGAKLRADYDGAVREYDALPDSKGGTVLNTDIARELSPDYLADRTRSADVHEPASAFVKRLYAEKLAGPTPEGRQRRVMFTAGGTGAGKTTGVNAMGEAIGVPEITYDTNMNTLASSVKKIEQALEAGRDVRIAYVYADPEQAFEQAMGRALGQKNKYGSGRTVPIQDHVDTHVGASRVIRDLADRYRHDLRVDFYFVDNARGKGNAARVGLAELPVVGDNGLRERLEARARKAHAEGRIDDATLAGFLGEAPARVRVEGLERPVPQGPQRGGAGRGQQQEVAAPQRQIAGPAGSSTSVVTERGLRVPVRYRLVEVDDLTTSHSDGLKPNPAFPADLQPRDRSRNASEAQIARIQNALQPELLADSPKASDGAPIVGSEGLVLSGNARTIALRRAYAGTQADAYRGWLADNAERFGLTPDQVRAAKKPVLAREITSEIDRADFARQANESPVSAMSDAEQARADAKGLPDLEALVANDDGTLNLYRSVDFIRDFMRTVAAPNERGQLMTADGKLSQRGVARIRNAVFARAYDDPDLVAAMSEATDGNVRNVMAGLLRAAPAVARIRELSEAGARGEAEFVPQLVEAVRRFSELREAGQKVEDYLARGSLIGGEASPRVAELMRQLEIDSRAPRRIADMVESMAQRIDAAGDPRQAALLDE